MMSSPPNYYQPGNELEFKDHPLFTLEKIYQAYLRCRRHKRGTINALIFEQNTEEGKVILRYPIPRFTLRFSQQKRWFMDHLPGHVLMIRQGGFWEMVAESCGAGLSISNWPNRFPHGRMHHVKAMLWKSNLPVAWIEETGRRLSNIGERALVCRWACKPDAVRIRCLHLAG